MRVYLGMSTGVVMRMNMKTTEETEKSTLSSILIRLFGTAFLFLRMRIEILFGHNGTLISILFRTYPKPHFNPDY
ncbi:hypothetical protein MSBR3_1517 [Methanosarcina barkeri 3]|uniref:Uncharacterized protein n=1 Tax=Methanosarcina barkeri 3 TaxID=1434107 RepID=A0A0E3WY18_METBA|nr:hypothetical protein MSBR3_1517 [Methanosarcina barkeri 3]